MNIFSLEGRIGRGTYFLWMLAIGFLMAGISFLPFPFLQEPNVGYALGLIMGFVCVFPSVRRLHDLNKSGWILLLGFIPILNMFFGLFLLFVKGTDGSNDYGESPNNSSSRTHPETKDDEFYDEVAKELETNNLISGSAGSSEKHNNLYVDAEKDRPKGNALPIKEGLTVMNDDASYDEVAEEGDTDNLVQVVWEGSMDDENDEVFFELAQNEINSGEIVRGLMLKAEVAAGGDEKKARIVYLQARAKQLYKEQLAREYVKQQQEERVLKVIQDVKKRLKRDCGKPVLQDLQKKMMGIEKEYHDMPEVRAVLCDLQYRRLLEKYFSTYEQISDFSFCVLESLLSDIEEFAELYPGSPYEKYWDGVGKKAVLVLDEKKFVETKRLAKGFLKNRHYDAAVRAYKDYLNQYSNHADEVVNILENKIPKLIKKKPPRVKGK